MQADLCHVLADCVVFFFHAEDGIRDAQESRGLGDVYKRQAFDTAWFEDVSDRDAYYMYRDLSRSQDDADTIKRHQLRFDITIIPPLQMGLEFVKTYGHCHPRVNPKLRHTYPEVYAVLDGDAHYLLQRATNGHGICLLYTSDAADE